MDVSFLIFISSGLFLGWSLGANDAANIFGTAVGTRMIRFCTAAVTCSLFVILGAVISGGGTSETIANFGQVNHIAGAFMVALAAALAVFMTLRSGITASTSQSLIGALIGWNLYNDAIIDSPLLLKIMSTWLLCPLLAAIIAIALTYSSQWFLHWAKPHLLTQDALTRSALILTGALGAYALGANNIGNVMGVFIEVSPLQSTQMAGWTFTAAQQLFLLGGLAIALGVFTYSKKAMMTIGNGIMEISPIAAWIVLMAHSIVLLMFSSRLLESQLQAWGLPTLPLVPVSSSQAVVGALIGLALMKGGRAIKWRTLNKIALGWLVTPAVACVITIIGLFMLERIGQQPIRINSHYQLTHEGLNQLAQNGLQAQQYHHLNGIKFSSQQSLLQSLQDDPPLTFDQQQQILDAAYRSRFELNPKLFQNDRGWLTAQQWLALEKLHGVHFDYPWQLRARLAALSSSWRYREEQQSGDVTHNQQLQQQYRKLQRLMEVPLEQPLEGFNEVSR